MGNKEMMDDAERVSNEKGLPQELIFKAIEISVAAAARKHFGATHTYDVQVNRSGGGGYTTYRTWVVIADADSIENPDSELLLLDAQAIDPKAQVGSIVKQKIDSVDFGRIAARAAKQVMIEEIRLAERIQVIEQFTAKKGTLVNGTVRKVLRDAVFVDLGGGAEAMLARQDMIPREIFRSGDLTRCTL
jgi:N utilization substance protein A